MCTRIIHTLKIHNLQPFFYSQTAVAYLWHRYYRQQSIILDMAFIFEGQDCFTTLANVLHKHTCHTYLGYIHDTYSVKYFARLLGFVVYTIQIYWLLHKLWWILLIITSRYFLEGIGKLKDKPTATMFESQSTCKIWSL